MHTNDFDPNYPIEIARTSIDDFVTTKLPQLNLDTEREPGNLANFMTVASAVVGSAISALQTAPPLNRDLARNWIQLLGFVISSAERHFQANGNPPGHGVSQFPGLDGVLVKLGIEAAHPPRDTHYTYWFWNPEARYMFTGPNELWFNTVVRSTDMLQQESATALRAICSGELDLDKAAARDAIVLATENTRKIYQKYQMFWAVNESGAHNMEPAYFMKRFRTYLATYPIGGESWGGVNAANVTSQMQMDYLVGTVSDSYAQVVQSRLRYLTSEDAVALKSDMALPSLVRIIWDRLLQSVTPITIGVDEVSELIRKERPWMIGVIAAFRDLHGAVAQLTAYHWALIQNYLVKPGKQLTDQERLDLPVRPDQGTGNNSHEATARIRDMRRQHDVSALLVAALQRLKR